HRDPQGSRRGALAEVEARQAGRRPAAPFRQRGELASGPAQQGVPGPGDRLDCVLRLPAGVSGRDCGTYGRPPHHGPSSRLGRRRSRDRAGREVFLVSRFTGPDGEAHERRILYLQITEGGDLYMDQKHGRPVLIEKVRPFKVIPGRSEIRDGRLVMPGTAQRPAVPVRKAQLNEPPGGPYLGLLRDNNREGTEVSGRR